MNMEINEDCASDSDEDHALSDDSSCISDCSENHEEIVQRVMYNPKLLALNKNTKFCTIYFYYSTGGAIILCTSCIIRMQHVSLGHMYAVRQHVIDTHDGADGRFCGDYHAEVYQTMPCNI